MLTSACSAADRPKAGTEMQWQWAYDDAGRLTQLMDPAGRQITFHYALDAHQRVQRLVKTLPTGSKVIYEFDRFERLSQMRDAVGSISYTYDSFGHLTAVQREGMPALTYSWDALDRLRTVTVGDGVTIGYVYDFLGRLAAIETPAGRVT
jgi:YD repeat-containing protein